MKPQEILDPQAWAESTFGHARLQDMRRTRRAVIAAAQMASSRSVAAHPNPNLESYQSRVSTD
jgi:hypothetical protein